MKILKKIKISNKSEWLYYIIIILVALILSAPLYTKGFYLSHDGVYHISRNYATNSEVLSKQIPPLIMSSFCKGYGYSWNIFYPPLGTYVSGIFSIFTSLIDAMKLTIILTIAVSGISMFKLIKKINQNNDMAFITSIIYMTATYFLSNIYCRMAMGEIMSYMFFPILFYGLYDIFYDKGEKNYYLAIRSCRNCSISQYKYINGCYYIYNICYYKH